MISRENLVQRGPVVWEIPPSFRPGMRVPARLFASAELIESILGDRSLAQLTNVACLPGIVEAAIAMPDIHEGYGFPIGGVAAMDVATGVVSPGGIGYDINCGVRLLLTEETAAQLKPNLHQLADTLNKAVPSGVGRGGHHPVSGAELDAVLRDGLGWAIARGFATEEDAAHIESHGQLPGADPGSVSNQAKKRGHTQLGTMGAGNHFVELDRVETLVEPAVARAYGLFPDQVVALIHCGSRGLGHQVATDYIRTMLRKLPDYGLDLPDRELACAPIGSAEAREYLAGMAAAANFAWVNRQLITHAVRASWKAVLGLKASLPKILYDVSHNIAKRERHTVEGRLAEVLVHRKGATRSFGPGHPDVPAAFRSTGQPVLIPGSMGTASYVLAGTTGAMEISFGSSCHGAGRVLSRSAAKRQINAAALKRRLTGRGIEVRAGSLAGLAEEAPEAYKDVDAVVNVVAQAGLAKIVARLTPLAVVKG